jgi:hypothetical protein
VTTYEHAMLGITGVLAAGLNRRYGWPLAAIAAVAAVSPDWDGLTIVAGAAAFAASHRVWGHNVWACFVTGILIGCLDYRFDAVTRCGRLLTRMLHLIMPGGPPRIRAAWSLGGLAVWISVAILAALSHLAADVVFSGTATLPDWKLQLWWPVSNAGYVFPLVPWGDAGVSIVFVAGMFAMWKWPGRLQTISAVTLAAVVLYVAARGAWL